MALETKSLQLILQTFNGNRLANATIAEPNKPSDFACL